jgi:hypothetical protein
MILPTQLPDQAEAHAEEVKYPHIRYVPLVATKESARGSRLIQKNQKTCNHRVRILANMITPELMRMVELLDLIVISMS